MQKRRSSRRRTDETLNIPAKANRILNLVLVAMILIVLRVWHLAVVQHDEKVDESRKPQRRVQLEPAKRATIRDRFNIPLAINKLQYNVAVLYSQIRQVPTVTWEVDSEGRKVRRYKRKEYIASLARLLGNELDMDAERIEDLIHAKAALYNQIPFVIKEAVGEEQYYRLKMLEKDWPGITVQCVPCRHYPLGKVASDIIGYMGAINKQEYDEIIQEKTALEEFVKGTDSGEVLPLPEGLETVEQVRRRLKDLQELAYTVNDSIGKSGIEGRYEKSLRGFRGKHSYYSDARGNFLRELPGTREPLSGKRVLLTISSELQEYAERLLIENEGIRQPILSHLGPIKRNVLADKQPWIKGGAIVAMDPNTGEVIAMASHPRFDPNDFIASGSGEEECEKKNHVLKWLESEVYLGDVWNQQCNLEREVFGKGRGIYSENIPLTWKNYLTIVLNKDSPLNRGVLVSGTLKEAIAIEQSVTQLFSLMPENDAYQILSYLYHADGHRSYGKKLSAAEVQAVDSVVVEYAKEVQSIRKNLDPHFRELENAYDKVLLIDLLFLAVPADRFSQELLEYIGNQSLSDYREANGAMVRIQNTVKKMTKEVFHDIDFRAWRSVNEKQYLKQKREEEKVNHRYAKPYIDYLDAKEAELFQNLWEQHRWTLITAFLKGGRLGSDVEEQLEPYLQYLSSWHAEIELGAHLQIDWAQAYATLKTIVDKLPAGLDMQYLQSLRGYQQLDRPLFGKYRSLRKNSDGKQVEKHLAAAFYPKYGYGYGRSQAYRQSATQGSIFKLVTAYEALVQKYHRLGEHADEVADLNPLEITDKVWGKGKAMFVGLHADGTPIPRHYKGGRMPRSLSSKIGHLNMLKALEMSSNPYFALLAGDYFETPNDLANTARLFSFGSKTGIDLPGEIKGNIPDDLEHNRTGLHSFAIGQHTLVVTPLQTSVMLSALVNGGKVLKPKIVGLTVGKDPRRGQELISGNDYFPYQENLSLVGIDFPLFVATDAEQQKSLVKRVPTQVQREIFLPSAIQRTLLDGMCRVVERTQKEGLAGLTKLYRNSPSAVTDYISLKKQFLGKTSTSESVETIDIDLEKGTNIYTHVWFGGISYEQDILNEKEHCFLYRDSNGQPELVVVVYLRYGGYGKEAAPVAAQVAKKWKEIKKKYKN